MTTRDLLEAIIFILTGGSAVATGVFSFATKQYLNDVEKFKTEIKNDAYYVNKKALETIEGSITEVRKLQQNHDNLLTEHGLVKCDVRDIKGVLVSKGIIHDRAGFPQENIPKRTGRTIEDA